jgi:hypothetical protein
MRKRKKNENLVNQIIKALVTAAALITSIAQLIQALK